MTDDGNVEETFPSQAQLASRAIVATGMAYPIGVMLGATFGVLFGDLLFAMVCFIFVPVPLTMVVFWRTTRNIDWSWQLQRTAYLRVFSAAFIATGLVMATIWSWTITNHPEIMFLALPVCASLVTLRTKSALARVM